MMQTNVFSIRANQLEDFVSVNDTAKLIVFYKQDCPFCKIQINDVRTLALKYRDRVNCAICDIEGETDFCKNNGILSVPAIRIYSKGQLRYHRKAYLAYEELEKILLDPVFD